MSQPKVRVSKETFVPKFGDVIDMIRYIEKYEGTCNITPTETVQTLDTEHKYLDDDIVIGAIPSRYIPSAKQGSTLQLTERDYSDIDKIILPDERKMISVGGDTVTAYTMLNGKTAHRSDGTPIVGMIPTYYGSTMITDSGWISVGGKYVPENIYVQHGADPTIKGTFTPEEDCTTFRIDLNHTVTVGNIMITPTSLVGGDAILFFVALNNGRHQLVYSINQGASINTVVSFSETGYATVTARHGGVFKAGITYAWMAY